MSADRQPETPFGAEITGVAGVVVHRDRKDTFHWHRDGAALDMPQRATPLSAREVRVPTRVHLPVWTRRDGRKSLPVGATAEEVIGVMHRTTRAGIEAVA